MSGSRVAVISSGSGDICSIFVSVVVQKQLFIDFSETCRTPRECRIESHSLFYALRWLFLLLSHLNGAWR